MVYLLIVRNIYGVSPYYTQNTWCVSLLYAKYMMCLLIIREYMVCLLIIRKIHCVFPTTVSSQAFQPMVNFIVNFEHIS